MKKRSSQTINGSEWKIPAFSAFHQDHPEFVYQFLAAILTDLAASEMNFDCSLLEAGRLGNLIQWKKPENL